MAALLESCSTEEVCAALGGSDELLAEQRAKLRDWLEHQPHLPQGEEAERRFSGAPLTSRVISRVR